MKFQPRTRLLLMLVIVMLFWPLAGQAQFGLFQQEDPHPILSHIWHMVEAGFYGALFGAFLSQKFKKYRRYIWIALGIYSGISSIFDSDFFSRIVGFGGGFIAAWMLLRVTEVIQKQRDTTFGSAEWADLDHLQHHDVTGKSGLNLGWFENEGQQLPLHYTGDRHLLTVAPTRSGKGVSAIIPNLLTYDSSVMVVDPKGENALITAARRSNGYPARGIPGLGQQVYVVDPWHITGMPAACFNPLDWLDPNDPDIGENALMLADAVVVHHGGDRFWDEEAKALLMGVMLFVATDENETDRTLGRVRDIIKMDGPDLDDVLARMIQHPNAIVSSTAVRTINKDPKLRSNVFTTLQSQTHFLDSPRIRASLSRSDFRFEDLKTSKMTIYLVLPADRLETFGRWLRLLIQQAITVNARNIAVKPDRPILFMLDEMGALGHLKMVEQAYSLMAGFGMQIWGIVQDLSMLERIYDKGWEGFISNSGVLQYFGSRDEKTAAYFSKLCGVTTIQKFSLSHALSRAFSSGKDSSTTTTSSDTNTVDYVQRPLAFPDELMVMRGERELVLVENLNPIRGHKLKWFADETLKNLGVNLKEQSPPRRAQPPVRLSA